MPTCPKCHFQWISTQRSNKQNAYMHGVVFDMIAKEMGEWDIEHVKDLMKGKFLRYPKIVKANGKVFQEYKIRHTSELDTKEMTEFIEKCRHWAAEFLGINIPDPEPENQLQESK